MLVNTGSKFVTIQPGSREHQALLETAPGVQERLGRERELRGMDEVEWVLYEQFSTLTTAYNKSLRVAEERIEELNNVNTSLQREIRRLTESN